MCGTRTPDGSKTLASSRCNRRLVSPSSARSQGRFVMPMPCSPLMVPPRSMAARTSSSAAASSRAGGNPSSDADFSDRQQRVQVAVAGVRDDRHVETVLRADVVDGRRASGPARIGAPRRPHRPTSCRRQNRDRADAARGTGRPPIRPRTRPEPRLRSARPPSTVGLRDRRRNRRFARSAAPCRARPRSVPLRSSMLDSVPSSSSSSTLGLHPGSDDGHEHRRRPTPRRERRPSGWWSRTGRGRSRTSPPRRRRECPSEPTNSAVRS